jgi:hypothetical protein
VKNKDNAQKLCFFISSCTITYQKEVRNKDMDNVWLMGLGLNLIFSPVADMNKLSFKTTTQNLIIGFGALIWTVLLVWGFIHFTLGYYLLANILAVALLIPFRYFLFENAVLTIIVGKLLSLNCLGIFN